MSEQAPGAPREEWRVRTDTGARKVIDRIDLYRREVGEMAERLAVLEEGVKRYVAWREALAGIFAAIVVFGGACWTVVSMAKDVAHDAGASAEERSKRVEQRQDALESFVRTELQDFKRELKADLADVKDELRNTQRTVERARPRLTRDGGP